MRVLLCRQGLSGPKRGGSIFLFETLNRETDGSAHSFREVDGATTGGDSMSRWGVFAAFGVAGSVAALALALAALPASQAMSGTGLGLIWFSTGGIVAIAAVAFVLRLRSRALRSRTLMASGAATVRAA
jgi:hypothetical protein